MIWASVIAGIAAVLAAFLGAVNHRKIDEVHVLVNARLDRALAEIKDLKASLRFQKTQPPESETAEPEDQTPHIGAVVQADQDRP